MKLVYEFTVHRLLYVLDNGDETGTFGWVDIVRDDEVIHTEEFHGKFGHSERRLTWPVVREVTVDMGDGGQRMEVRFRNTPDSIFECDVALEAEQPS